MPKSDRHFLGIGIRNVGSALSQYGGELSDDALGIRGMLVTDETMLANLREQTTRLLKLLADATALLSLLSLPGKED
jgi:hypothetical protein